MAIRRLRMEMEELRHGQVNCCAAPVGEDLFHWTATIIGPPNSPYAGGVFGLDITIPSDYPFKPPKIVFTTKIYHCNVNVDGEICLNTLKDDWSPALSILKVLLMISSLLSDPNPDSPLIADIAKEYRNNRVQHDNKAREWTLKYAT